jgi:molecular chaperone HscB
MSRVSAAAVNLSRSEGPAASGLLAQDYFSLLGLEECFGLDQQQLESAWRKVQSVVHPDRFSSGTDAQRRLALQWSTHLNEAYKTLRSPIARATYLLERRGHAIEADRNTAMPIAFLEAQMSLRESFAESKALASQEQREAALMRIRRDAQDSFDAGVVRLAELIDRDADHAEAVVEVRALHFFEKFLQDLDR